MKSRLMMFTAFLLTASHALAQTPAPPAPPEAPVAPRPAAAQTPKLLPPARIPPAPAAPAPPAAPALPAIPSPPRQPINIRVDLTITEEGGGAPAIRKTVSTVAGDGFNGSVRETATLSGPNPIGPTMLNFDAQPTIVVEEKARGGVNLAPPAANQRVRVGFNIQYAAGQGTAPNEPRPRTDIRLNLTLLLESGKALKIWEGADPIDKDRRVSVEVVATILK